MESDSSTLLGFALGVGGLITAILYNALMIKQNTKARYYEILKDIDSRFHNIQDNTTDGPKYLMYMANLGQFIKMLIDSKIIPKKYVLQSYKYVFGEALWYNNNTTKEIMEEPDTKAFIQFCKENNIPEMKPPEWVFWTKQSK